MARLSGSVIDKYCAEGKPVWIKNKTNALVLLEMPGAGEHPVTLNIPPGQHPFCISEYMAPDAIRSSNKLREAISKGNFDLMDPDDPALQNVRSAKTSRSIVDRGNTPEEMREMQLKPRKDVPVALDPELEDLEASPKIAFWCDTVDKGDMKEADFLEKVKETEDTLTENDLAHIIQSLRGRKAIVEWATNVLAAKREQNGEDEEESDELETSSGTQEDLEKTAQELLARSKPRGNNIGDASAPTGAKIEHNTLSKAERQALHEKLVK